MKEYCGNCKYKNRGSLRYPCSTGVYQLYHSHRCFMWRKRTWWQRLAEKVMSGKGGKVDGRKKMDHKISGYESPECGNDEIELGQSFCQDCGEPIEWKDEE